MCVNLNNLIIRKGVSKAEFVNVYKVFRNEPYNELWPDDEIEEEFESLNSRGTIYGAYIDKKCVGIITFYDIIKGEHPISYSNDLKVAYFSDIAVLDNYRKKGIATKLLKLMIEECRNNSYDIIYMRTMQKDKSMSYHMAVKNGFKVLEGITEDKMMERTNGQTMSDNRIFLELRL